MRSAADVFYLAFLAFLRLASASDNHGATPGKPVSSTCAVRWLLLLSILQCLPFTVSDTVSQLDPKATVSDACTSYSTIDSLNNRVYSIVQSITQDTDFFSYYRLNLFNKECPFWSDADSVCGNIACAVTTIDSEEDVPLTWRAEELSKLEGPKAGHPGRKQQQERPRDRPLQGMLGEGVGESCVVEYDDECDERDYCVPEDEGASGKGDYVSLVDNPERFTGYSGVGARQVWDAIYRENCFLKSASEPGTSPNLQQGSGLQAANELLNVLPKEMKTADVFALDNECLEKRVFHRLISGMHASISTHLCWDYLNKTTGQWHPNLQCFKQRLYNHPEWISNMYFNYALVSRAVAKLQKHLQSYTYCASDPTQDLGTKDKVSRLTDLLARQPQIFDEHVMFQDPSARGLKADFRNRFRNVTRLMDCVGCDKCRLWGKLQTNGYGTALKVLFEYDEAKNGENPPLRRTELVALMNTLGRISHSVAAAQRFRHAIESGVDDVSPIVAEPEPKRRLYKDGANNLYFVDDEEDFQHPYESQIRSSKRPEPASFMEEVMAEFGVVWDTFMFVLKSWVNIPKTM